MPRLVCSHLGLPDDLGAPILCDWQLAPGELEALCKAADLPKPSVTLALGLGVMLLWWLRR